MVTMFHRAILSTSPTMEAGMPHLTGSKPFGNWPPTVRVIAARRGTRIMEPAWRVTFHSPDSTSAAKLVWASSSLTYSSAISRVGTEKITSWSRNTSASSSSVPSL